MKVTVTIDDKTLGLLLKGALTAHANGSAWCRLKGYEDSQPKPGTMTLLVEDTKTGKTYRLTRKEIARGVTEFLRIATQAFGSQAAGDVFLQCCLFGKVVYRSDRQ